MLSDKEYQDLLWKVDHIPTTITGTARKHLRSTFRKKIHEHELASRYRKFQPLPYEQYFINHATDETTLIQIIQAVKSSNLFTLDTESVGIFRQKNKPALIQLQVILHDTSSLIIFIEVCHLPRSDQPTFTLIQQLFKILFTPENKLYIWGDASELEDFVEFDLFTLDQIDLSDNKNLQNDFKIFWNEHHQHQTTSLSSINNINCTCETCLGIDQNNEWSLQNSVAYALNQWLDKRFTRSSFHIGLDSRLRQLNSNELEYRISLIQYAADDCLAMEQILIYMDKIDKQQPSSYSSKIQDIIFPVLHYSPILQIQPQTPSIELLEIDHTLETAQEDTVMTHSQEQSNPTNTKERSKPHDWKSISSNDDEPMLVNDRSSTSTNHRQSSSTHRSFTNQQPVREELTPEERRRIHNRSCTLRQRQRNYKHEVIRRNIDRRFTIREMKTILRRHNVPFNAINVSTSSIRKKTSLYIGIRNPSQLHVYEQQTENLFTTDHYNELHLLHHRTNSSYRHRH